MRKIIFLTLFIIVGAAVILYSLGLVGEPFLFIVGMAILTILGYLLICFRENKRNFQGQENQEIK